MPLPPLHRLRSTRAIHWLALLAAAACSAADQPTGLLHGSGLANQDESAAPVVVVSQIYGGGGNSGATLTNDFVELFNPGAVPVDLSGWTVQYASATGTSWQTTMLSGTIQPKGYYLVQESAGQGGTQSLPTPDASGGITMSANAGKVALVHQAGALSGACPVGGNVIDLVGFGATANCAGTTANLANTTAAIRKDGGCTYTNSTSADFDIGTPSPRNSAGAAHTCGATAGPVATVTITPTSANVTAGATATFTATAADAASNAVATTYTWSSGDEQVATVDANGIVTGVKAGGPVTITATAANGVNGTATITVSDAAPAANVVISQVYGGGGNSGATYANDYVELFNPGTTAASIAGWTIQYTSATGTTWGNNVVTLPNATMLAGHYYLIKLASQAAVGAALPAADAELGTINMSGTSGKVLLVAPGVTPSGACPAGTGIIDHVEFGASANCGSTWGGTTANLSSTLAAARANGGCTNTNNVASDFAVVNAAPRNGASAAKSCVVGALDHVTVSGPSSVSAGSTIQLAVAAQDVGNNPISGAAITWASSDPSVATVSATGVVTGATARATPIIITAHVVANGVSRDGTAQIMVTGAGDINWLDVNAASTSVPPGFQTQLFITARVASGGTVVPATYTFEALDPSIATIQTSGSATFVNGVGGSATRPRFRITATPAGGGTPYQFTTSPVTIEIANPAPASAYSTNDEFGDPTAASASNPNDRLVVRPQYTLSYNQSHGTPNWVSYELDARQTGGEDRCNCFTADPQLPATAQIFTTDYTNGGYDRGHMTRSADRTAGNVDNAATFYLTNVVPQMADLNQGVWAQFEDALADSAQAGRAVYIVTGPLYSRARALTYLKNEGKVAIPDSTWKIALIGPRSGSSPFTRENIHSVSDLSGITVLAVNMPNVAGVRNDPWSKYLTTISRIEQSTGYNFLSLLGESVQCRVEMRSCAPEPKLATATGSTSVAAGSALSFNVSAVDGDGADGPWRLSIEWGDGTTFTSTLLSLPTDVRPLAKAKVWTAPGTYTIRLTITDKKGAQGASTMPVTVTP